MRVPGCGGRRKWEEGQGGRTRKRERSRTTMGFPWITAADEGCFPVRAPRNEQACLPWSKVNKPAVRAQAPVRDEPTLCRLVCSSPRDATWLGVRLPRRPHVSRGRSTHHSLSSPLRWIIRRDSFELFWRTYQNKPANILGELNQQTEMTWLNRFRGYTSLRQQTSAPVIDLRGSIRFILPSQRHLRLADPPRILWCKTASWWNRVAVKFSKVA